MTHTTNPRQNQISLHSSQGTCAYELNKYEMCYCITSCDIQPWIFQKALLTCIWLSSPLHFTAQLTTSTQHQFHKLSHYQFLRWFLFRLCI